MPPVRESRHLWVGNIPDSITEEKLVEYFQRYGRIDSVKILAKRSVDGGQAAFVDFVDIRCAIKAHETPNRLGDRDLRTDYNEPASSTLTRSHTEQPRRYERGGRGPGDEGYSSRQNEGYQANYPYKDEAPPRRDYERVESGERNASRITEGSPGQYQQHHDPVVKAKDSDSGQSGSGTAPSGSGSDSSDSGDSESETDSDSSVSETSKGGKKTRALQIRNLSSRSTDATIREGLYHEFKKHGDVGHIKVLGRDNNRHAIVCFRRHEDVIKAMEICRGKMFLGLEMELTPCEDEQYEGSFHHYRRRSEGGSASFGNADDVYMFNATRTIFVGNIERNATSTELKRMFERYGEIVDVDIKKQGSNGAYAFIQYLDITHAVEARKQMNRALSGRNRLKIGFGKGMPTSTIWIGGLVPTVTEQLLDRHFQRYGRVSRIGLDQERSYAMVTFDNLEGSTMAHDDVKRHAIFGKRVRVDYASRESQHFFYDHLARTGQGDGRRYEPSPPPPPSTYRPRSNNKSYEEPVVRSRTGIKQENRGSKYHPYDHGYDRGPGFNEGGRRHYDEYFRGPPPAGGYESDDFDQELREYNVTRERERARERAREREQDRRQEPPPRRRHHRETGRHEGNTESDGERYYSHSDVWPGDSGKDRGSRESSVEPREDNHRRGDKRKDGDKRRGDDKRVHAKGRYEGQSEEDLEPIEKQVPEKKEQREKNLRKKPIEAREDYGKPEFYPTSYEKGYDGKEKDLTLKREVRQERDIQGAISAEEGEKVSMEEGKGDLVMKEEKVRTRKEERSAEKALKKMKNKDGKKKRKNKKSPVEIPPVSVPSGQVDSDGVIEDVPRSSRDNVPQSRVEIPQSRVEIPQSRVEIPQSRVEIPQSRVEIHQSRVDIPRSRVEIHRSRVEIPQSRVEMPQSRVEMPQSRVEMPQSRVEIPQSRVEIPHSRVEILHSRVEKREEPIKEHKKARKSGTSLKSAVVVKNAAENSEKDRRQYRDNRRPKSPSPQDHPEEHISRKRPRSPERDVDHYHAKNTTKHADSGRHSNGDHDDMKRKKRRQSIEATPPPPPPPPPPAHHHSSRSIQQSDPRKFAKERNKDVSSSSRDAPPSTVGQSASARSSRDTSTFKPHVSDISSAETTKHVTSAKASSNASPTESPVPAQSGSGLLPNTDDTLMELLRRHPVMWQGLLGLKNDSAAIQMHYVSGNSKLAEYSLPKPSGGTGANGHPIPPVLRIAQRMKMEASQLEGVTKRMQVS